MSGPRSERPNHLLALVAVLVAASLLATASTGAEVGAPAGETGAPRLVLVEEDSSQALWPYTSRRRSVDGATLPINVVVHHDAAFVRSMLSQSTGARWNVTDRRTTSGPPSTAGPPTTGEPSTAPSGPVDSTTAAPATLAAETERPNASTGGSTPAPGTVTPTPGDTLTLRAQNESRQIESGVVINGTSIRWAEAEGSTRYTYVYDVAADQGRWTDETYQLHDGHYLGTRYHVRLYEGGSGRDRWTAIQVHREHWDWFRLRHTVDSVDRAQDHLESEFRSSAFRIRITRTWFANPGPVDSDGWVTTVDLVVRRIEPLALPGFGLAAVSLASVFAGDLGAARVRRALRQPSERLPGDLRHLLLFASLMLLVLGVRVGAIALERSAPGLSPKVIAAVFYPLLVLGTPACAVLLARGLEPLEGGLAAAGGFGAGVVAEYAYLNIATLPLDVVLHRTVLITTVALFAAGSASRALAPADDGRRYWNELLAIAVLQWAVALLLPLFDLL